MARATSWQLLHLARRIGTAAVLFLASLQYAIAQSCAPEHEPNDEIATAGAISGAFCISGGAGGSSADVFVWTITPEAASQAWTLGLEGLPGQAARLEVSAQNGSDIVQHVDTDASGSASLALPDASSGPYVISIAAQSGPGIYRLRASANAADIVAPNGEPDDILAGASPLDPVFGNDGELKGDSRSRDRDHFLLTLDEAWLDVRFDVVLRSSDTPDDAEIDLALLDPDGTELQERSGHSEARLGGLVLQPGPHVLRVTAAHHGSYRLSIERRFLTSGAREREPNDAAVVAMPLDAPVELEGTFGGNEWDTFVVTVKDTPKLWTLRAVGASVARLVLYRSDGEIRAEANRPERAQSVQLSSLLLLPGRHIIGVRGEDGNYRLHAFPTRALADAKSSGDEIEPNEVPAHAQRVELGSKRQGRLDYPGDVDTYRLSLSATAHVSIVLAGEPAIETRATIAWGDVGGEIAELSVAPGGEPAVWDGRLAPGDHYLRLSSPEYGFEPYSLRIERLDTSNLPVDLEPNNAAWSAGQLPPDFRLSGRLGNGDVDWFRLPDLERETEIVVAGIGASDGLRLTLFKLEEPADHSPWADAEADRVARFSRKPRSGPWRAQAPEGGTYYLVIDGEAGPYDLDVTFPQGLSVDTATASSKTAMAGAAALENSVLLPDQLLGGLNMAWAGFGGSITDGPPELIDGASGPAGVARLRGRDLTRRAPTIALGGADPAAVAGFILDGTTFGPPGAMMKAFEISASLDGETFAPVLAGEMAPFGGEQAYVLQAPVSARFVRLEPLSNQSGNPALGAEVAELKVVAAPSSPRATEIDLARPELGGHIVWRSHDFGGEDMLTLAVDAWDTVRATNSNGRTGEWVLAFFNDRAAEIEELRWIDPPGAEPAELIPAVALAVSTDGPLGPWREIGTWRLQRSSEGVEPLRLSSPTWARYLRFTLAGPFERNSYARPETISVIERPPGLSYRSILGEWGKDRRDAAFEQLTAPAASDASSGLGGGPDKSSAPALELGATAADTIELGQSKWYRIGIPNAGTLQLTTGASLLDDVAVTLETDAGRPVSLSKSMSTETGTHVLTAPVTRGSYYMRVFEPSRSIMIAWDTSGSVADSKAAIIQAITNFVAQMEPDREEVNLLPFRGAGSRPLLDAWSDDPIDLYAALQNYDWADSSSNAEAALLAAATAFAKRPGRHAMLVITDGRSDGDRLNPALWRAFEDVQPRIDVIAVPTSVEGGAARRARAMMLDWISLNGGQLREIAALSDIDDAFTALIEALRVPASYEITAVLEPPRVPGRLEVISAGLDDGKGQQLVADQPVEIILDASGSMLQRIGTERRIDLAKATIEDLVRNGLPSRHPFALRVFGQGPAGSCETELLIPLGPLNAAAAVRRIEDVTPTNLARTPIAKSLRLVADDLAEGAGAPLVTLITDGEETCGGDPLSEIRALAEAGVGVRVNIVGFAINDPDVAGTFRAWADAGAGMFVNASDAQGLRNALRVTLQPAFEVLDAAGIPLARSSVGGTPLELPAGTYAVRILSSPPRLLEAVKLLPGELTSVAVN